MTESIPPRIVACPACGKSTAFTVNNRWRPFCSERCRVGDLGAWATESYRIPAEEADDDNTAPGASSDQLK